jgi:nucleoside-triphosphatase
MYNLLLTSEKGCNLSTELLQELVQHLDCTIGGYLVKVTKNKCNENVNIYDLTSLYDGEEGNIFLEKDDSTGISKLDSSVFEIKGVEMLRKSFASRDLIIMDEIGFFEPKAPQFTRDVFRILDSNKVVLGVLKSKKCDYINSVISREDVIILKVTSENLGQVKEQALQLLKKWEVRLK